MRKPTYVDQHIYRQTIRLQRLRAVCRKRHCGVGYFRSEGFLIGGSCKEDVQEPWERATYRAEYGQLQRGTLVALEDRVREVVRRHGAEQLERP